MITVTPFERFRLWWRRAPVVAKTQASLAALLMTAGLVWTVLPSSATTDTLGFGDSNGSTGSTGSTGSSGASGSTGSTGSVSTTGTGGTGSGGTSGSSGSTSGFGTSGSSGTSGTSGTTGSSGSSGSTGSGCFSPPGTAQGVTATKIKIMFMLSDINVNGAPLNDALGIPRPEVQRRYFEAVVDDINKSGGVICRQIDAHFLTVNPFQTEDLTVKCKEAAEAKPFAVLDTGGATGVGGAGAKCYAGKKLPFFAGGNLLTLEQANQHYPYIFAPLGTFESIAHNTILALRDRGFFTSAKGFRKLGFLHGTCTPKVNDQIYADFAASGVPKNTISDFDFGCTGSPATPNQINQALLQFQQDNVSHVVAEDQGLSLNFTQFTIAAQKAQFKPVYGLPDETFTCCVYSSTHPDYDNLDGATVITYSTYGDEHTAGSTKNAATKRCDAIFAAHGESPSDTWKQGGGSGGVYCGQTLLFVEALQRVPDLSAPDGLARGMAALRSVAMSYPFGPNDFSGNHTTVGGQFWRVLRFYKTCPSNTSISCFQVVDRTFRPSYR